MAIAKRTCVDCGQKKPQTEMKQVERKSGRSGISTSVRKGGKFSFNLGRNYYKKVWVCKGLFKCGKPPLAEREEQEELEEYTLKEAREQQIIEDKEQEELREIGRSANERIEAERKEKERIQTKIREKQEALKEAERKEKEKKIEEEKYQTWATQTEYEPDDRETRIKYTKHESAKNVEKSTKKYFLFLAPFFLSFTENMLEIFNVFPSEWDLDHRSGTIFLYIVLPYILARVMGMMSPLPLHEINIRQKFKNIKTINWLMLLYIVLLCLFLGREVFSGCGKSTWYGGVKPPGGICLNKIKESTEATSDGNTSVQSTNKDKESAEETSNDNASGQSANTNMGIWDTSKTSDGNTSVQSTNKDKESTEETSNDNTSVQYTDKNSIHPKQGDAKEQTNLGIKYYYGNGVTKSYKEAARWFTKAAEQGDAKAQNTLGSMYDNGQGVPKDQKKAVKWIRLSAEQGYVFAQYNLGHMYYEGKGVPQDLKEAIKWFKLSAKQGNSYAQKELGLMYQYGRGVPEDYKEAVKWYTKSAEQGFAIAQVNLGLMYLNGKGVPQDLKEAIKWFELAEDQGDTAVKYPMKRAKDLLKDKLK